jgi:hypothetical protein
MDELAALIVGLDMIITADNTVAHLAGALGGRADWRYGSSGASMPWYASMRPFRQAAPGNWQTAIDAVSVELRRLAQQ